MAVLTDNSGNTLVDELGAPLTDEDTSGGGFITGSLFLDSDVTFTSVLNKILRGWFRHV